MPEPIAALHTNSQRLFLWCFLNRGGDVLLLLLAIETQFCCSFTSSGLSAHSFA
jgi:hypothetical protein